MKLIVDANVIISAVLKNGRTREILPASYSKFGTTH
jgi:predicted nucleic acid-binding protein